MWLFYSSFATQRYTLLNQGVLQGGGKMCSYQVGNPGAVLNYRMDNLDLKARGKWRKWWLPKSILNAVYWKNDSS
jgi:hypothetical protein